MSSLGLALLVGCASAPAPAVDGGVECVGDGTCDDGDECTVGSCSDGVCRHVATDNLTCAGGGRCRDGDCVCEGCWSGERCEGGDAASACGVGGGPCSRCDDGLTCTSDTCASGTCMHAMLPDACLLDGACVRGGVHDPHADCRECAPASATHRWTERAIDAPCMIAGIDGECGDPDGARRCCLPVIEPCAGNAHTCAIAEDHNLYCWGNAREGELGIGEALVRLLPVRVGRDTGWARCAATGANHTCAIRGGRLFCWGENDRGQLGTGDTDRRLVPTQVGTSATWTEIATGEKHSCGLQSDASLWCWGRNDFGQLGVADGVERTSPERVGVGWAQVSVGRNHTCAIRDDESLWCWGIGELGRLGLGGSLSSDVPARVGSASWARVAAGRGHT
ncbi:MAG: hypothetical protein K8H88_09575, partial [Sandaracinaceae bacterium]|nr:hypothetical protein [Sandaracinaceae bacterium]